MSYSPIMLEPLKVPEMALQAEAALVEAPHPITPNAYPAYPYQCTRFAKDMRPDIPNYLGTANDWFDELTAMGWDTGYTPKAGAIGQSIKGVHVVYVIKVDGDQIYLAERNWDYNGSYRERWADAADFKYIY